MKIQSLGHVVVRVRDLARSEAFYADLLGLPICARYNEDGLNAVFFTLGDHHDFAIVESAELAAPSASGLDHVAFKIGDDVETLKAARQLLNRHDIETRSIDHGISKSLYLADPDGNEIELYVDLSDSWRSGELVVMAEPFEL